MLPRGSEEWHQAGGPDWLRSPLDQNTDSVNVTLKVRVAH